MRLYIITLLSLFVFISGCGGVENSYNNQSLKPNVFFGLPEKALSAAISTKAYATLDDKTDYDLSIYSSYVGGTITGITNGDHTIVVHIQGRKQSSDDWVDIITVTKDITINGDTSLAVTDNDLMYPDSDNDGESNLDEIVAGTNPFNNTPLGDVKLVTLENNNCSATKGCGCTSHGVILPNPFITDNVNVSITNTYNVSGYNFTTGLSKWHITDSNDETIAEITFTESTDIYSYGEFPNLEFTSSNGLSCLMHIKFDGVFYEGAKFKTPSAGNLYISAECSQNNDECSIYYETYL